MIERNGELQETNSITKTFYKEYIKFQYDNTVDEDAFIIIVTEKV